MSCAQGRAGKGKGRTLCREEMSDKVAASVRLWKLLGEKFTYCEK